MLSFDLVGLTYYLLLQNNFEIDNKLFLKKISLKVFLESLKLKIKKLIIF